MAYDESWDRPHEPGSDPLWQESDCYWFFDRKTGVGGYHRLGQFTNKGTGQEMINAFRTGGHRFRLLREHGGEACKRTLTGQSVGNSTAETLGQGRMRYTWDAPECDANLEFYEAFYEPRDWVKSSARHAGASAVEAKMNTGGHLECSGRIRGTVRLGKDVFEIDALAHRDRSWGARDYRAAYQHRMVTGTLGPELSWATFVMRLSGGVCAHAGFVDRHGVSEDIARVEVITGFADDGLTVADLRCRIHLTGGESIDINGPAAEGFCALTDGWLVSSHHYIECGDSGFTILDATNRPSKGDYMPSQGEVDAVCMTDGLSPIGNYGSFRR